MATWNPKKWFGRGKEKPAAPAPAPQAPKGPEPSAGAPAPEKKRGVLGKIFGRGKRKEKPAPEAPPAAPPAPPAPPAAPPAAEGPEKAEEAAPPEREYPSSIQVEADGDWIISSTEWSGLMKGTIHGHKAKVFIDAYEKGHFNTCAQMVADAWDANVASQIIPEESTIDYINWS
ncbi:hypothetical protein [Streptomyces scopuliridis]|uniref:Uncharacterized protein n=1 Tax=Streptomyces scopuliridis TaxID=452529 RepID=A0ACD4ZZ18_9ACTN|nr:hypothetical protein [Streptomyces scopuliridis]WSC03586.1 hypothetical protein OG835_42600 [Streptomyces scopuliridis]